MKQVRAVSGVPLGAAYDAENDVVALTFVLDDGDHLHVQIGRSQLQTLSQHIAHVASQLPAKKRRGE
jgi:hypothetical protein